MPKSYRFRTEVGVDKEVRLNIDQDELDIRPSNVMVNQKNHLKLVDI